MNRRFIQHPEALLLFLMGGSVLVPRLAVAGRSIGVDDILAIPGIALAISWLVANWRLVHTTAVRCVIVLWLLVIFFGTFVSVVAVYDVMDAWVLPTEIWQYIKRFVFFLTAAIVIAGGYVSIGRVCSWLCGFFCVALAFGLLQSLGIGYVDAITELYARTTWLLNLAIRETGIRRVVGVAGHPVSWAGFSSLGFALALGLLLGQQANKKEFSPDSESTMPGPFLLLILAFLSIANVFLSGSRVGILSVLAVLLSAFLFVILSNKGSKKIYLSLSVSLLAPIVLALSLFEARTIFLVYRALTLLETQGGGRVDQVQTGLELLARPDALLVGVGNASQRSLAVGHGIEVEPIYLLVNYGIFGLSARLLILGIIAYCAWRLYLTLRGEAAAIGLAALLALASSIALMSAYFFFQEIVVGTTVWILFGAVAGEYERRAVMCGPKKNLTPDHPTHASF